MNPLKNFKSTVFEKWKIKDPVENFGQNREPKRNEFWQKNDESRDVFYPKNNITIMKLKK